MLPQPLAELHALAYDPHHDVASRQRLSAPRYGVRLVRMQLDRPFAAVSTRGTDQRHGIDQPLKDHAVVTVRASQEAGEENPLPIDDHMPFLARSAAIRGIGASRVAPLFCRDARAIQARPVPIGPTRATEPVQQDTVQSVSDPGRLPVAQAARSGDPGPTAYLHGEALLGDAGLEDEEDAR